MVDNKDEYQLPEDEKTEEYTPKAYQHSTENVLSMLKNQKVQMALLGAVGLSILMYVVSGFLNPNSSSEDPAKDNKPPAEESGDSKDNDPENPPKKPPVTPPSEDPNTHSDELEQLVKQQGNEIASINNEIEALKEAVSSHDVTSDISEIKQAINDIMQQIKPKPEPKPEPKEKLEYFHLRAAQEGRAYIQNDTTGQTTSVAIGDHVKTYGTIEVIDAEQGIIKTSSGRLIEFNEEAN